MVRLIYVETLGHDASFGYIHAVKLCSDSQLVFKKVGYVASALFLHEQHELILLLINTISRDLRSDNFLIVCAALEVSWGTKMIVSFVRSGVILCGGKKEGQGTNLVLVYLCIACFMHVFKMTRKSKLARTNDYLFRNAAPLHPQVLPREGLQRSYEPAIFVIQHLCSVSQSSNHTQSTPPPHPPRPSPSSSTVRPSPPSSPPSSTSRPTRGRA